MRSLPSRAARPFRAEGGYALVALLVAVSVMAVLLGGALPVWQTMVQREREAELVFRGEQYARAIARYQRQYANAAPPDLEILVEQRFLRKRYTDPMTPDGAVVALTAADVVGATADRDQDAALQELAQPAGGGQAGGIVGVTSASTRASLREYNGATQYNAWLFLGSQFSQEAGFPGGSAGSSGGASGQGQPGLSPVGGGVQPTVPGRGGRGRGSP